MQQNKSAWRKLLEQEPAVLIGLLVAFLSVLTGAGLAISGELQESIIAFVGALVPILQGVVTRQQVYAPANVLTAVKDGEVFVVPEADPEHAGLVRYDPADLTEGRVDYEDSGPADYIGEHRSLDANDHSPADG